MDPQEHTRKSIFHSHNVTHEHVYCVSQRVDAKVTREKIFQSF